MKDKTTIEAAIERVKANNLQIVRNSSHPGQLVSYEALILNACDLVNNLVIGAINREDFLNKLGLLFDQYDQKYHDPDGVGSGTIRDVINAIS